MFKRSKSPSGSLLSAGTTRVIVLLLLILAVVAAIRVRLLDMPLERDEGEFAYGGQMLLQGLSPYKEAYNVTLKLPGTCVAYALIMEAFGQTTVGIHAGLILVNLTTVVLVFLLMRRMGGNGAGVVAAGIYALLSIVPETLGLAAHATHFVLLPALAGIFLLQNLDEHTSAARIFFAGLLLGLAFLMKQTGAAFGLFAAGWTVWCEYSLKNRSWNGLAARLGCLTAGGLLPFILTCVLIVRAGDFAHFRLWTFQYAYAHSVVITFGQGINTMIGIVIPLFKAAPGLWGLAMLGLILLFGEPSLRRWRVFIVGFAFFSCVAVWPGWREHYFIQLLPAAGLLAGVAFRAVPAVLARLKLSFSPAAISLPVFAIAMLGPLIQWSDIYFRLTPAQACRAIYSPNPFPEAVEIGRYLESHCAPDARIVVMGSEPEIYFYSHRRSATGYICTYPLMEQQPYAAAMQSEMIHEIEKANPKYVVYVNISFSWLQTSAPPNMSVVDWFEKYRQERLQLVGTVEILSRNETLYRWFAPQDAGPSLSSKYWLAIFRNRSTNESAPPKSR